MEVDLQRISKPDLSKIGYSMTLNIRSSKQRVHIFLTEKNLDIKTRVEEKNPTKVLFQVYRNPEELFSLLQSLGDNIGVIVEHDHDIEDSRGRHQRTRG